MITITNLKFPVVYEMLAESEWEFLNSLLKNSHKVGECEKIFLNINLLATTSQHSKSQYSKCNMRINIHLVNAI